MTAQIAGWLNRERVILNTHMKYMWDYTRYFIDYALLNILL